MKKLLLGYYLLITMILPNFHYRDCVQIKDEFYGTLYGWVVQKDNNIYSILITSRPELVTLTVHREFLQKVNQDYCKEPK